MRKQCLEINHIDLWNCLLYFGSGMPSLSPHESVSFNERPIVQLSSELLTFFLRWSELLTFFLRWSELLTFFLRWSELLTFFLRWSELLTFFLPWSELWKCSRGQLAYCVQIYCCRASRALKLKRSGTRQPQFFFSLPK